MTISTPCSTEPKAAITMTGASERISRGLRQQDAFARMSFVCAGTTATPIDARHRCRNDCWRPDCCRLNLEAQLQRASKNAEDVIGIKWKSTWAPIASSVLNFNQYTSDGTRARRTVDVRRGSGARRLAGVAEHAVTSIYRIQEKIGSAL